VWTLKEYNRIVLQGLDLEEGVVPGEIRKHSVVVGSYRAAPAEDCDYLLERLSDWLEADFEPPEPDFRLPWVILKAVVAHLYFVWIHPFGDGNGRTARLMELQTLLAAGVPTPTSKTVSAGFTSLAWLNILMSIQVGCAVMFSFMETLKFGAFGVSLTSFTVTWTIVST